MKRGLLLLVLLLLVPTVVTGACNITDDTVISTSTSLAANETPCSVTDANSDGAIIINASDVALTCQNFQLSGNGTGYGIYSAKSGATIDSCDVTGYGNDVYFSSNYSSLINSILAGTIKLSGGHAWVWNNTLGGVSISGGWYENNTIINNTINGGISISSQHAGTAPWFKIINNTITMSTYKGKAIDATSATPVANAEISGNKITASSGLSYCIRLYGTYNTIKDNTMDCNFKGISFFKQSTNYNTIMNNVMTGGYLAFDFVNSHYNNITSNNVTDFSNAMAFASGAANNLFWNNYFYVNSAGTNSDNIFNITKTAGTNIIGGNWTAGNWWWNYLGDDNDGDGIGDTMLPHNNDYAPIIIAPSAYENCDMTFSTLDIEAGRTYNFTNCNLTFGTVSVKQYGKLYIQDSVVDAESSPWSLSASTNSIVRIKDSTLNNCIISSSSDLFSLTGNTLSDCNNAVTFTGDEAIITGNTIGSGGLAVSITGASKVTLNTNTFTGSNKKIYLSGSSNAAISDNTLDEIEMRGGLYNNISDMSMNKLIFEPNSSMAWNLTFPSLEPRIAGGRNDVWDITSYSGLNMSGSDNVVRDSYVLGVVYFQYGYKENNTLRGSTIVNGSIYPQSQNPTAPKLNIINNTINFTASEGIDNWMTSQAAWSVISGNKFYSKNPTAIDTCIKWKGSDNIISDNRFNCTRGLRLGGTAPTKRNNITGNYFTGGHYGLLFKSDNTINNSIWNNYFDNEYDVYFHCNATYLEQNNRWNITKVQGNNIIGGSWMGGNFWHDYDGYDSNGDGLGDSDLPHWKDWLPLTTRGPPDDGDDSGGDDDLNKIVTPGNKTSKNETEEEPEVKENQDDNSTEIYIPEVDENESVSVDLPNEKQLVVQIVITPSKRVPGIHIVVKKLPEKPADVDRKHGAVYQYLKIDKNVTDEEIKEAVIKFVVDREWLEKNGLNPDKIKLVRWNRGKWEKLPTEREVDDGDYFDVNDDEVTVKKSGKIKIKVLGSAFSARGENIPVYAWGMIGGGGYEELFGGANVNTDKEAGYYSQEFDVSSGDKVHIKAKGRLTISTEDGGKNVIVLRNGDTPPYFKPFGDQPEIASFLSSVMDPDTGKVSIGPNDVLYLFELWTTKASSSAFDMQDLIVLVSYEAPEEDSYTYSSTSEGFSYFAIIADMPEITEASVSGPTGYFIFPTTEAVLAGVVIVIGVGLLVSRRKMLKRKKKVRWLWS